MAPTRCWTLLSEPTLLQFARNPAQPITESRRAAQSLQIPSSLQPAKGVAISPSQQQHTQEEGEQSSNMADAAQNLSTVPDDLAVEPTLKDVFMGVSKSNATLDTLSTHVGKVQADISFIR